MFSILTLLAFLLKIFGLDWLESKVTMQEPSQDVQWLILGFLKIFELAFVYKILCKKSMVICALIAVAQTAITPWLGAGFVQSCADFALMFIIPFILRKDKWHAVLDALCLNVIMCLYGLLYLIGRFGGYTENQIYSFHVNIASMIDYKLFIATLYLYIKYKGGIQIWKMKRKIFQ